MCVVICIIIVVMEQKKRCLNFAQGLCKFGNQCKFAHDAGENSAEYKDTEKLKYIDDLIEGVSHRCKSCDSQRVSVVLGCGCETLCCECAAKTDKCPEGHRFESTIA